MSPKVAADMRVRMDEIGKIGNLAGDCPAKGLTRFTENSPGAGLSLMSAQVTKSKRFIGVTASILFLAFILAGCQQRPTRVYKVSHAVPPAPRPMPTAGTPVAKASDNQAQNLRGFAEVAPFDPAPAANAQQEFSEIYHVGPGDVLEISVFQLLELEKEALVVQEVDRRGQIYLPLLNHVPVAGMTCDQVRDELTLRLGREFIREPKVAVAIKQFGSKQIAVLGAVARPGAVALRAEHASLLEVISQAGGLNADAAPTIEIVRGGYASGPPAALMNVAWTDSPAAGPVFRREVVPVSMLFAENGPQLNPVVYAGDVVKVPEATAGVVYLAGEVKQPGARPFRRQMNVLEAVACGGGATSIAQEDKCKILRRTLQGQEQTILVNLEKVRTGTVPNVAVAQNDTILLPVNPTKKFFADLGRLFRGGVVAGVDVTYDAGSEMGWPQATGGL